MSQASSVAQSTATGGSFAAPDAQSSMTVWVIVAGVVIVVWLIFKRKK